MDARLKAANVILDRGVRFRLPAPFWKKWLKKDYVTIHHLKAGTIIEIARVVIDGELEDALLGSSSEFLSKSVEACARCVAIAILNEKKAIEKRTDKLTHKLVHEVSAETIINIYAHVVQMNRVADFMNTTKYLLTTTAMLMSPKNLGQENGS